MATRSNANPEFDPNLTELFVEALRVRAQIGLFRHERGRRQPLVVSIRVWAKVRPTRDSIRETIDYDTLVDAARNLAESRHFDLIETYLEGLAGLILSDDRVHAAHLKAVKPEAVDEAQGAGVAIYRVRSGGA